MTTLNNLSLTELAELRTRGEFDAAALLESCVDRIVSREDDVQAFEYIDIDKLRATPLEATTSLLGTGLEGIPFGVKDLMDTCDMPTGWGSPIYTGRQAGRDAGCVAMLRACGAQVVGKTVTTEFACFFPGKTRNPRNPAHTPGGSSQGSAAAVADCMVPFALGTQTAASIIRPAAYCGVIGYKTSRGAFDLGGICSLSQTLDSLGFFVRNARDLGIIRSALMRGQHVGKSAQPARVGLVRTPHWEEASVVAREAVEGAAEKLSRAGVIIEELEVGPDDGALTDSHKVVMAYEAARARIFEYKNYPEQLSQQMISLIETGLALTATEYNNAIALAREWMLWLDDVLVGVDCLISPSTPGEAPAGLDSTGDPVFSRMWTLLGQPSINLPVGEGPNGMPIGIQLIGRNNHDDTLISHAAWMQPLIGCVVSLDRS